MGLLDYTYRLKPQAGDTTAHNEVGGAQAFSGGGIALVDLGSGVMAWRFTGAASMATITARTLAVTGATLNGGVTIAIRFAVTTDLSVADAQLLNFGSTTGVTGNGVQLRRGSAANTMYGVLRDGSSLGFTTQVTTGTTMKTHVLRLRTNVGGLEYNDWWYSGGGAGPAPDSTSSAFNAATNQVLQYLHLNPQSIATLDVRDLLIWPEELPEADCDALRDDIDAALAAPAPTVSTQPTAGPTQSILLKGLVS